MRKKRAFGNAEQVRTAMVARPRTRRASARPEPR